jgi:predicted enzyme related to lactoylglutathione lyase
MAEHTPHNPVVWCEIYVQDMPRAKAFYGAVLGVEFQPLQTGDLEMWAFPAGPDRPGSGAALVRMPGVPSGGNSSLLYFGSADCAVEESRVAAAGGKVFRPKMSIGEFGFITLAVDPDGNMFGIHSMA